MSKEKSLETVVYLANQKPNIEHISALKIIFAADMMHFKLYGRTVTEDIYVQTGAWFLPTRVMDVINCDFLNCDAAFTNKVLESLRVTQQGKSKLIFSLRDADFSVFSVSDLDCLQSAFHSHF